MSPLVVLFFAAIFQQAFQLGHEFLHVLEIHVNRSEADVGDFVELLRPRMIISPISEVVTRARWLRAPPLRSRRRWLQSGSSNRAFLASFQQALENFLALEAFTAPVFLGHHVWNFVDAFVGGEAAGTLEAFASAADGVAGAAFAGIDHFVVNWRAKRTLQGFCLPPGPLARSKL